MLIIMIVKFYLQIDTLPTYKIINPKKLGHAVIINNVAKEFPGSKKDTEALMKTYQMMNFEVCLYEDCDDKVQILCKAIERPPSCARDEYVLNRVFRCCSQWKELNQNKN